MKAISQIAATRAILEANAQLRDNHEVCICGLSFTVMPNVLSPKFFGSTEFLCREMPFRAHETFLEIGPGLGAIAVLAALKGATRVVAADINPDAIMNTRANAERFEVSGIVECVESDIFDSLRPEKFNTIFWNIPFVYVPDSYTYESYLERAVFDPGYRLTERFISQARRWLAPDGRILLGFGDFGDVQRLNDLAEVNHFTVLLRASALAMEGNEVEFFLYELLQK